MLRASLLALAILATSALDAARRFPCLCVFDLDRTLTGLPGDTKDCPANTIEDGVKDCGYEGGVLTLSELGSALNETFCGKCSVGVVSAGTACGPGSRERAALVEAVNRTGMLLTDEWASSGRLDTPLITGFEDGQKQVAVAAIV